MRFQCDTTQPEFEKNDPVTMYKNLTQNLGVISYEGAGVYMIIDQIMADTLRLEYIKGQKKQLKIIMWQLLKAGIFGILV